MVKVKEVKHSDEEISSSNSNDQGSEEGEEMIIGESQEDEEMDMDEMLDDESGEMEMDDESGEFDMRDTGPMGLFDEECEEGEVDMDDYGEEGELEFMELASGESESATHSSDEEEEAV